MMGRESGSAGDYKTTEYVAAEFQRLGRRATLQLPSGDVLSYAYHPELGALATITDPRGNRYRYTYDLAGQIDSAVVGTSGMDGLLEARRYDAEGRLFAHVRSSPALGTIYTDSLTLDALGRTIRAAYGTRANLSPADTTYLRRGEIAREISPSAHEERGQASGEISRVACGGMLALAYFVAWSTDHH